MMNNQTDNKVDSHASSFTVPDSFEESRPNMEGYDPNRIPLSVFTSKPSNHPDWSLASSESLFSITLGRSFEANFLGNYKSSTLYRNMESMDISALTIDAQIQDDSKEMQVSKSFIEDSEPAIEAKFFHPNTDTTAQEKVEEKEEEKSRTQQCNECLDMLTPTKGSNTLQGNQELTTFHSKTVIDDPVLTIHYNVKEQESPVHRARGSLSMYGNEDLINSLSTYSRRFRYEDRCELPQDRPTHSIEFEIEEDVQTEAPRDLLSAWLSCFHCNWKSLCCGCL